MTDVFTLTQPRPASKIYDRIGFSRNPFSARDDDDAPGPFFTEHIGPQVARIQTWLARSLTHAAYSLSIRGTIGTGKSRILREIRRAVLSAADADRVHCITVFMNKSGYSRPSVGQLLLDELDNFRPTWDDNAGAAPRGIMPLVWAVIRAAADPAAQSTVAEAVRTIRSGQDEEAGARNFIRWLHRELLTPNQADTAGVHGRIDYEGQLPDVLCDLLSVAAEVGVLNRLYFMVDQLEDLMTQGYSPLRQSRILTDLRTLIDKQDAGVPLRMVLAWSPDAEIPRFGYTRDVVDEQIRLKYSALYSRLTRELTVIEKLREVHVTGFAEVYVNAVEPRAQDRERRPSTSQIAVRAWELVRERGLARDNTVTPRDLLDALEQVTDDLARDAPTMNTIRR